MATANLAKLNNDLAKQPILGATNSATWLDDTLEIGACTVDNADPSIENFQFVFGQNTTGITLLSDVSVDCQLMIKVSFKEAVNLTAFQISANKAPMLDDVAAPQNLKFYVNREIGFEDTEDDDGSHQISLEEDQLHQPLKLKLPVHKFRNVHNLAIFVEDNLKDADVTFLNSVRFEGKKANTMNVSEIKKAG